MSKIWREIGSNAGVNTLTDAEKRMKTKKVRRLLRNVKTLSIEEIKEETDIMYKAMEARKAYLEAAIAAKKNAKKNK